LSSIKGQKNRLLGLLLYAMITGGASDRFSETEQQKS
jgi:hypothetical protein